MRAPTVARSYATTRSPVRGRGRFGMTRGRNMNTGYYTPEQWALLSRQQQDLILRQRGTKRNISAINSDEMISWEEEEDTSYPYQAEFFPPQAQDCSEDLQDYGQNIFPTYDIFEPSPTTDEVDQKNMISGDSTAGNEFGQRSRMKADDDSRYTGMFQSSARYMVDAPIGNKSDHQLCVVTTQQIPSPMELDSHADTCTIGSNCKIIAYTNKNCQVSPYHPKYKPIDNVPIVQAAATYVHPETGHKYILVINQALYLKDLPNTLISPNQLRAHSIVVDDCPKHLAPIPSAATHSIYIPQLELRLPLQLKGVLSYLPVHYPSEEELTSCPWIELTSDAEWNPTCQSFEENERLIASDDHHDLIKNRVIANIDTMMDSISPQASPIELHDSSLYHTITNMIASTTSTNRKSSITPEQLSTRWNIGIETAARTINATTQLAIRQAIHPLQRRYRTEIMQLRYPRLGGRHGRFHTDTFFAKTPSLSGATMAQLYTNDVDFTKVFPMRNKSDAPDTLISFMQDVGIPSVLHTDDARELTQGRMGEIIKKAWIKPTQSEPYSPWQVRAELCNRELKKTVRHALYKTNAPKRLWDYCATYHSDIRNFTAHPHFSLQGRTPYEIVTGNTPDISEYTDYSWYDTVWYHDQEATFPENTRILAKWLGVAHRVGQALCYYLLPSSGKPIVRSTVQPLTPEEAQDPVVQKNIVSLDQQIMAKVPQTTVKLPIEQTLQDIYDPYEPEAEKPEILDITPETYDSLISAEVILPQGDTLIPAVVKSRKRNASGQPIGIANPNPMLDTRVYEVAFPDGHTEASQYNSRKHLFQGRS